MSLDRISDLPNETLLQIVADLEIKDLASFCSSSRRHTDLCRDDYFWKVLLSAKGRKITYVNDEDGVSPEMNIGEKLSIKDAFEFVDFMISQNPNLHSAVDVFKYLVNSQYEDYTPDGPSRHLWREGDPSTYVYIHGRDLYIMCDMVFSPTGIVNINSPVNALGLSNTYVPGRFFQLNGYTPNSLEFFNAELDGHIDLSKSIQYVSLNNSFVKGNFSHTSM